MPGSVASQCQVLGGCRARGRVEARWWWWWWVIRPSAVRRARGGGLTGAAANAKGKEGSRDAASVDIDLTRGGKGRPRARAVMLKRGGAAVGGGKQTEGCLTIPCFCGRSKQNRCRPPWRNKRQMQQLPSMLGVHRNHPVRTHPFHVHVLL